MSQFDRFSVPMSADKNYWSFPVHACKRCGDPLTPKWVDRLRDAGMDKEEFICPECVSFVDVDTSALLRDSN